MENMEEEDPRRVKFAATKVKSHAALWWDNLQNNWKKQGKEKIRLWPKMLKELKVKFFTLRLFTDCVQTISEFEANGFNRGRVHRVVYENAYKSKPAIRQ